MVEEKIATVKKKPQVLLLYFSFSGQISGLVHSLAEGLQGTGINVVQEKVQPIEPLHFPFGTVFRTLKMMFLTFLRIRMPIEPLKKECFSSYDLIILAGPTWSYNPSGPILSLLDRDGKLLFNGRRVLPLISCRSYWRTHFWVLRWALRSCGAKVENRLIFTHPTPEPWLTLGVFFKLAGKNPERSPILGRFYRKYGHSKRQFNAAQKIGEEVGEALLAGQSLAELHLPTI